MSPTDKLFVRLEAQQWEQVIQLLADGRYRVVAPLIQELQRQCVAQQGPVMPRPGNGAAHPDEPHAELTP